MTVNAVVLYWVTAHRPDDQAHNYYLTTINFSIPFTTHSVVIPPSRPPIAIPDPAQNKTKPYRHASAMASRAMISSYQERFSQQENFEALPTPTEQYGSFDIGDRSTGYPVAHREAVESVRYERCVEGTQKSKWNETPWRWLEWPPRRHALWRNGNEDRRRGVTISSRYFPN